MYAVVETGGKQYRVSVGDKLMVEKLDVEEGTNIELDRVLMVCNDGKVNVGTPLLEGTAVSATVLTQGRGKKIRVYKFKRRTKYRRTQGHRQSFTQLEITAIGSEGSAPKKAKVKKAETKKDEPKKVEAKKAAPKKSADKPAKAKKATAEGDKLTDINGIGPVIEQKLKDMGITTFQQIADFTPEQVEEVGGKLNFKGRIEREEWIAQAKKLAA